MLNEQLFDVVVIGGGLTGAGIARDAAMRGYATLLVEREDFGAGATRAPSTLAADALRDLGRFAFGAARAAQAERAVLERIAPHLARPVPALLPVYAGERRPLPLVGLGAVLSALLAGQRQRPRTVGAAEARRLEPALEPRGLAGAVLLTDQQIASPERLCLETVLSAREAGAKAVNHVEATALRPRADGITEVDVRSTITGATDTVAGRVVVNAAGAWADRLRALAGLGEGEGTRLVRRVQVVLPRLSRHAIATSALGRRLQIVPYRTWSVVSAAEPAGPWSLDRQAATADDVERLLDAVRRVVPEARATRDDVCQAFAGLHPDVAGAARRGVRAEGPRGTLLTVAGGPLVAARALAETVTDRIAMLIGRRDGCRTAETPLYGGQVGSIERALGADAAALARRHGLPTPTATALVETYGSRAADVLGPVAKDPALARRLCERGTDILAQVRYAVERESAVTLRDLLLRRLSVGSGPCQGRDCAPRAADLMARLVGWDERRRERELAAFLAEADLARAYLRGGRGAAAGESASAGSITTR